MRTVTTTAILVVAALAGISADARAEVLDKTTFKGAFSFGFFSQNVPITCADGTPGTLTTSASVSGNEFISRSRALPDEATNTVFVNADRFNSCTGESVFGSASVNNAFTQTTLQTATMVANVTLLDFDGNPVGTASVNLTLTGTGPTSSSQSHSKFTFEGPNGPIVVTSHSKGTFRNATASGSVVFDGTELIGAFLFGSLQQVKSGSGETQK